MNLTVAFMRAIRTLLPPDVTDGVVTVTRAGDQVSIALTIAGAERPIATATGRRQRVADERQPELFDSEAKGAAVRSAEAPAPVAQAPAESPYVVLLTPDGMGGHEGLSWAARYGLLWFDDLRGALFWGSEGGSGKGWDCSRMVTVIARQDLPTVLAAAERAELVLNQRPATDRTGDAMLRLGTIVRLSDGSTREVVGLSHLDGASSETARSLATSRVRLSDETTHALTTLEHCTDGSGDFRLVPPSPSQRAKKRTEITAESLRGVQRVRVRPGYAGISGVPVTLAGEPVTVMSVGPKRVKVRTDGEGRTHSIPFAAVELLSEEP